MLAVSFIVRYVSFLSAIQVVDFDKKGTMEVPRAAQKIVVASNGSFASYLSSFNCQ